MSKRVRVRVGERWYAVEVFNLGETPVRVLVDGEPVEVDVDSLPAPDAPPSQTEQAPARPSTPRTPSALKVFRSPMAGVIISVAVKEGDQVVTGDEVCVLEAMKMHQTLRADWSGLVRVVHVQTGQQVMDGDPIVELE